MSDESNNQNDEDNDDYDEPIPDLRSHTSSVANLSKGKYKR